jgi:TfoX/Sxy family transcriptional regulator of competence genes
MAYDNKLADRIRQAVGPRVEVIEKKMFGGLAFLLKGKMFCVIVKDDLMVRVEIARRASLRHDARKAPVQRWVAWFERRRYGSCTWTRTREPAVIACLPCQ